MTPASDISQSDLRLKAMTRAESTGAQPKNVGKSIFHAAEKSAEFFDHLRAHFRETRRTRVEISCDVKLVMQDGTTFDSGSAEIHNVSPSGALVSGLKLSRACYPAGPFKVVLVLKGDDYNGIGIEATPIRLDFEGHGLGVRFDEIFVAID